MLEALDTGGHLLNIHHSEIALKKGNRSFFESRLKLNIQNSLSDIPGVSLKGDFGRFFVKLAPGVAVDRVVQRLQKVIGIANIRIAYPGATDPQLLKVQIFEQIQSLTFNTFSIDTRRADKSFPFTSVQMNQIIGAFIHQEMHKAVDLENADLVVKIEIFNQRVYYSVFSFAGERGLPLGSTGKVVSMISSGIDSPVASFMMMKRGCHVTFVHFHSFPFTEKSSTYNAMDLVKKLTIYQNYSRLYLVPLAELQKAIILAAPAKLRVVMYRRMMFRLAEKIARLEHCRGLVTGESLGQVASQTLDNIAAISETVSMPVLRPLIGMEKDEIVKMARRIDTFSLSTEPYDDCCSYLAPPKPETNAKLHEIYDVEGKMGDWPTLLDTALAASEVVRFKFPETNSEDG
ncbi:MAG: tRNA 4-thiouridine(8) synthase ThiI [Calditrichaeota bacterium]|nr:MAG: tRNA 4-thiouridine(8) synthase ThiI [Calditrichota bacterium]